MEFSSLQFIYSYTATLFCTLLWNLLLGLFLYIAGNYYPLVFGFYQFKKLRMHSPHTLTWMD